jgi:hypothetical protein
MAPVRKTAIHTLEASPAAEFAGRMISVRAAPEVLMERSRVTVDVLCATEPLRRSIFEFMVLAKTYATERRFGPIRDANLCADVGEITNRDREPWKPLASAYPSTQSSSSQASGGSYV